MSSRAVARAAATAIAVVTAVLTVATASGPTFYPDDPLLVDRDDAMDASGVQATRIVALKDVVSNTLGDVGDRRDVPAMNVSTIDEVPDSSWFTNRLPRVGVDAGTIARGPDRFVSLSIDGWPIVEGKGEGMQPGFRVVDPNGHLYQVKLDPRHRPEMTTAAEIIGTAFFHAFGYNVADVYLVEFDPARTVIADEAVIRDGGGRTRRLVKRDIDDVLAAAAPLPDGRYRALASRFIDGRPLGQFRYWGTRPDDPNDVIPHEHRRELRALRVFAAWLNHDESSSTNTLDVLADGEAGRRYLKHYLLDFGSLLGSDTTRQQRGRGGHEYLFEWGPGWRTAATLGLFTRPWLRVDYPPVPSSVGRFESSFFDPLAWKPVYPNPAFENLQPADGAWAARLLARLTPDAIEAVVAKARYSHPAATAHVVRALIERRAKILQAWLPAVAPIDDVNLDERGRLSFRDVSVEASVAPAPSGYRFSWFVWDNERGMREPAGASIESVTADSRLPVLSGTPQYVGVDIETRRPGSRDSGPATIVFRRDGARWTTVGLTRPPAARPNGQP